MAIAPADNERVRRLLLLQLLQHHGQQVRFEASQWTTEFGLLRQFPDEDPQAIRSTLRALEMARLIYQRTQYVVGYSEPKTVYSLTPSGHRQALDYRRRTGEAVDPAEAASAAAEGELDEVDLRPANSG